MDRTPVAAAVVVYDGRLLLIRRRVAENLLSWQLPAGKVESGEAPGDAAAREALEEAGVGVAAVFLLGERVHPDTGRPMSYWACRLLGGQARVASPREVAEIAWVDRQGLARLVPGGLFGPVQAWLDETLWS
ncbi:hypothetical protein GCM10010129_79840 [Streptomyces fumigatiscleroticus]|nr:hypothetical protein GCM10010129_79840 [Streptomyces fumigatiscleroticus]